MRPCLLALVLLVSLAGCGGGADPAGTPARDELIGTADVERLLVTTQKRRSPRLRGRHGQLPRAGPPGQRHPGHPHGPDRGHHRPYAVTLRDVDAGRATGRFALEPAKPIIDVTRVVGLNRSKLQPTARAATVRCGPTRVRVVEIGATIGCTVTLGDAVQKVTAEVKDLQGTVVVRG